VVLDGEQHETLLVLHQQRLVLFLALDACWQIDQLLDRLFDRLLGLDGIRSAVQVRL
jgi:hypothetical protein